MQPSVCDRAECVGFADLDLDRRRVRRYSSRGTAFDCMVPFGMPRIPPKMLDCVCYLYHSEEDARAGRDVGGTAFLIALPTPVPNRAYVYAITNWHVACEGGASVLRVNARDGGDPDVIALGPEDWFFDPRYDLAVAYFNYNPAVHLCGFIPVAGLALKEHIDHHKIGPGDDVFMVGRFVDHDGGPVNRPAVRFGNISVMPSPIMQPNGRKTDAYCIDLHSRGGYSGSPVFAYRTPGYDLEEIVGDTPVHERKVLLAGTNYLACLGIHFAQFPEEWELVNGKVPTKESSSVPLIKEGAYIKGLSGMTCVLPAWTILEVLNLPKLKEPRDATSAALVEEYTRNGQAVPVGEVVGPVVVVDPENPDHLEDFTSLLSAAVTGPKSGGQT